MSRRAQSAPLGGSMLAAVQPAGPTVEAFILDFENRVQGIMGPVGGGKTTGCIQKVDVIAAVQPICHDGVIRSKGIVWRDNFRTLEKTVLASWFEWFPKEMRDPLTGTDMWDFSGGNDRPAVHTRRWKSPRGIIESITEFVGIGNHRIEDITRGSMWTWGWGNEWDLDHEDTIDAVDQRLPRYPPKRMLKNPDEDPIPFLFGDFNAPDNENWTYNRFKERSIPGYRLYEQPGGMEPNAENRQNLPRGYYENMIATKPDWWVRRFVHNQFGYSRYGKPVYPEFNERKHMAERELMPVPQIGLRIGIDAGGTPAAVIAQQLPNGQVRWLDEVVSDKEAITGPRRFGEALAARLLQPKYAQCQVEMIDYDPSALYGADTADGQAAWIEIVSAAIGVPAIPHYTNEPSLRQEPVRHLLTQDIDGRIPALQISPTCRKAGAGMAYGYRFENVKKDPKSPTKEKPEKNDFSHVCEAGEYVTGSYTDRHAIIQRSANASTRLAQAGMDVATRGRARAPKPGDFDVFRT
jgi:hypothetical protein